MIDRFKDKSEEMNEKETYSVCGFMIGPSNHTAPSLRFSF